MLTSLCVCMRVWGVGMSLDWFGGQRATLCSYLLFLTCMLEQSRASLFRPLDFISYAEVSLLFNITFIDLLISVCVICATVHM